MISARDQHHSEADALFRSLIGSKRPLVTTNLVVAEVHRLILFRVGPEAARIVVDRIEASPLLTIEFAGEAHHRRALDWLDRLSDQKITYTDAISFAVMTALRCKTTVSFDQDFEIAGFTRLRSR